MDSQLIEPFATTVICEAAADRGRTSNDVDWSSVCLYGSTRYYIDLVFEWVLDAPRTIVPVRK